MKKIAVLVDVQNVYYTTKSAYQRNFDYNKFWANVTHERELVKAIAYAIEPQDDKQRQFQNILRAIGFELKLKPYIQRSDGSAKGDWDVGITIDALEFGGRVDTLVLVSGDGDFTLLVEKLQRDFNISVEIYGVPALTAGTLKTTADNFIPIEDTLLI